MTSRMLVSEYVSEVRDENRKVARACNVATWFIQNFSKNVGCYIAAYDLRLDIPHEFKDLTLDDLGDRKAHSDACFGTEGRPGLKLSYVEMNGVRQIEFSLPNLKRCTSYLLGQGPKVHALKLLQDPSGTFSKLTDVELIDQLVLINSDVLTSWEAGFVHSLNHKWRERGLSERQRNRAIKIIKERI